MTSRTTSSSRSRPPSDPGRAARLLRAVAVGLGLALTGPGGAVVAQDLGQVIAPILVVDRDRLFAESAYGQRISAELEAERERLEQETRDIEAALAEEELELTEQRATLEPAEFRALADAFDEKVQRLRDERSAAQQTLVSQIEEARTFFLEQITPVLARIMVEAGAQVMLDRRSVLLSSSEVDVTSLAISRIDELIGDGDGLAGLPEVEPVEPEGPADGLLVEQPSELVTDPATDPGAEEGADPEAN